MARLSLTRLPHRTVKTWHGPSSRFLPRRTSAIVAVSALLALTAACGNGGGGQPAPTSGNQFTNPGFEEGRDPWFALKPPDFILSEDQAHAGDASALLEFQASQSEEGTKISYLVQEIQPEEFPEVLSGYYRVDNWEKGTRKQYLQFVVIVFGAANLPGELSNHQIRYILAGIDSPPFGIDNAHFIFDSKEDPPVGEWVKFEHNVREDFVRLWGAAPEGYANIRVLFEVRYDDKSPEEGPIRADVYYDDLYFGPAPTG